MVVADAPVLTQNPSPLFRPVPVRSKTRAVLANVPANTPLCPIQSLPSLPTPPSKSLTSTLSLLPATKIPPLSLPTPKDVILIPDELVEFARHYSRACNYLGFHQACVHIRGSSYITRLPSIVRPVVGILRHFLTHGSPIATDSEK